MQHTSWRQNLVTPHASRLNLHAFTFTPHASRLTPRRRAFVATNPDANYPGGFDELLPAGGAVATYVGYAAERPPDVWVGKPSRDLAQLLVREHGLTPARNHPNPNPNPSPSPSPNPKP